MLQNTLQSLGWNSFFHRQCLPSAHPGLIPARVISQHNDRYHVMSEHGECTAKVTGKFRYTAHRLADYPVVGDFVWIEPNGDHARIHQVMSRKNSFSRKMPISGGRKMKNGVIEGGVTEEQVIASNLDTLFIMCGVDGNFNIPRIERYLTIARHQKLEAVILLNKIDLVQQPDHYAAQVKEIAGGASILPISAAHRTGLDPLAAYMLPGKTIVFIGSSGVGKSTLLNTLLEREVQTTRLTSHYSGKGKHTTTHRQMFFHPSGCMIVDTPGMKELQLWADDTDLDSVFAEIAAIMSQCRFSNCTHRSEPGCALQAALKSGALSRERYGRYTAQLKELQRLKDKKREYARRQGKKNKYES